MRKSENRSNGLRRVKKAVGVLVSAVLVAGIVSVAVVAPMRSEASTLGTGVSVTIPFSGGAELWFGTHINTWDGAAVYCAEFNVYPTTGWGQSYAGLQGSGFVTRSSGTGADESILTKTLTAADMTALNYVLSTWGNTSNANQAASVGYAVWAITTNSDVWSYQVSRPWFVSGTAAFSGNGDSMVSQGRAYAATAGGAGAGSASMSFNVELGNNYLGDLTLDTLSPSPASGVIALTNGIFVSTGTASISSSAFTQGQSLEVRGVPPTDDGVSYKISASASFDGGFNANVGLYTTGSRQHLIAAGGRTTMSATADDPFDRSVGFQPILTSQVEERYLGSGDPLIDNVVFSIQADENGVVNEWATRTDGLYFRVVARGTVYGPFPEPQVQAATVPIGAPVAGTATVTTTSADGPTVPYAATADNPATGAGYYVWVWEIGYYDQPAATKLFLPAPAICLGPCGFDGYYWADAFGIHNETAIVVAEVVTAATPTGVAGFPITDTATVTGAVFTGAEVEFEAYLQVDDVPTCTAATLAFTSTRQPAPTQGDYTSDGFTPTLGGTYFWVETLYDDTGAVAHRGVCGEPLETTIVDQFALTTVATQSAAPGAITADTATIRGVLPTDSELMFSAYYSETNTPVCLPTNLVYTTTTPIAVPAGFHDESKFISAGFDTTGLADGYLFWVESLTDDTGTVIGEGECGAVGEITQLRTLASTGLKTTDLNMPITVGALLLLLGGLLVTITVTRRRATTAL